MSDQDSYAVEPPRRGGGFGKRGNASQHGERIKPMPYTPSEGNGLLMWVAGAAAVVAVLIFMFVPFGGTSLLGSLLGA